MNLSLPQPDSVSVFKALYKHAAANGRDRMLFGTNQEKLFRAFEKMPLSDCFPNIYLEFPLCGDPFCDLICMFHKLPDIKTLKPYQGYGLERTLEWRKNMKNPKGFFCLEADVSSKEGLPVSPVWDMRFAPEEAGNFLETLDAQGRIESFNDYINRMPKSWKSFYIGLYPGRKGAPLRIGVLFSDEEKAAVHENPDILKEHLTQVGFTSFDDDMLSSLSYMIRPDFPYEIQFDLYPDGRLGESIGAIATIFGDAAIFSTDYMVKDKAALFMAELEEKGMIDGRWRLLHDSYLAKKKPMVFEDGSGAFFHMFVMVHSVKLKYNDRVPSSKCYLGMCAGNL